MQTIRLVVPLIRHRRPLTACDALSLHVGFQPNHPPRRCSCRRGGRGGGGGGSSTIVFDGNRRVQIPGGRPQQWVGQSLPCCIQLFVVFVQPNQYRGSHPVQQRRQMMVRHRLRRGSTFVGVVCFVLMAVCHNHAAAAAAAAACTPTTGLVVDRWDRY